jgi:hypothetical protein
MNYMKHWEWKRDILWYKGRIFGFTESKLKKQILRNSHDSAMEGQSGFLKTYQRIKNIWGGRNEERHLKICKRMLGFPKK